MDGLPDSLFVSKLCHFLDNPVIRIESTPSEEVAALKKEVEELKQAKDEYVQEVISAFREDGRLVTVYDIPD